MLLKTLTTLVLLFLSTSGIKDKKSLSYNIPCQKLNIFNILGKTNDSTITEIQSFEATKLVTFSEYKIYLETIEKDSSELFYRSQLPDSNIIPSKSLKKLLVKNQPIFGISWENALNYCKWKTFMEKTDSLKFVFKIPNCSEWCSSYSYLENTKANHDFNKEFSEWTENAMYDNYLSFKSKGFPNIIYNHKSYDNQVAKRKIVLGKAVLTESTQLTNCFSLSYFATKGYKNIGFRCVKVDKRLAKTTLKYWGIKN